MGRDLVVQPEENCPWCGCDMDRHDFKPSAVQLGYHDQFVLVCRVCDRNCARGRRSEKRVGKD